MQTIEIEFCHPINRNESLLLSWTILENEITKLWLNLFYECINTEKKIFPRFTGFIGGEKNKDFLLNSLQNCIDIINRDGRYKILERAENFSQEFANIIHHHFEILGGSSTTPSDYFKTSSPDILNAVSGLNYFIHDLEAFDRNQQARNSGQYDSSFAGVIVEFKERKRIEMPQAFYQYFTPKIDFGDIVTHYSQLGKTWLEAFYDQDDEIFPEAIRPHHLLSGEFDIMFGKLDPDILFTENLNQYLKKKEQNPGDPSLRLGHLPLAKFNRDSHMTNTGYKDKLAYFCDIKSISVLNNNKYIIQKILMNLRNSF